MLSSHLPAQEGGKGKGKSILSAGRLLPAALLAAAASKPRWFSSDWSQFAQHKLSAVSTRAKGLAPESIYCTDTPEMCYKVQSGEKRSMFRRKLDKQISKEQPISSLNRASLTDPTAKLGVTCPDLSGLLLQSTGSQQANTQIYH